MVVEIARRSDHKFIAVSRCKFFFAKVLVLPDVVEQGLIHKAGIVTPIYDADRPEEIGDLPKMLLQQRLHFLLDLARLLSGGISKVFAG